MLTIQPRNFPLATSLSQRPGRPSSSVTRAALGIAMVLLPSIVASPTAAAAPYQWSCHCINIDWWTNTTGCTLTINSHDVHNAICTPSCYEDPSSACWSEINYTLSGGGSCSGTHTLKTTAACEVESSSFRRHNGGAITLIVQCGNCVP